MRHQQNALHFFLRCTILAGTVVCLSTGFELILERSSAESDKNSQVASTGQFKGDCLAKNGTPIHNGQPCGLTIIVEERKDDTKPTCGQGVCKNGTCTEIQKTNCDNN
uniref:Evasin n=1 Tax=Rhipicephalus appendiculatus TaxID=34631 RepID=A0A131YGQ0_RHIAP